MTTPGTASPTTVGHSTRTDDESMVTLTSHEARICELEDEVDGLRASLRTIGGIMRRAFSDSVEPDDVVAADRVDVEAVVSQEVRDELASITNDTLALAQMAAKLSARHSKAIERYFAEAKAAGVDPDDACTVALLDDLYRVRGIVAQHMQFE